MKEIIEDTERTIADRFFYALEILARRKVIRGLQTFTRRHGLNYGNMNTLKNNRDKHYLRTYHLAFLVQDYGVSCEWLLLGNGEMFTKNSPANYGRGFNVEEPNDKSSSSK